MAYNPQVEMRYSQDDLHHKRHRSKLSIRRRSTPNLWPMSQRNLNEEKEAGLLTPGGTMPADTVSIYAGYLEYDNQRKSESSDSLTRKSKKSRRKTGRQIIEFFKKPKEKSFDDGSSFTGALFGQPLKDVSSPVGEPPLSVVLLLHQLVSHGPSLKGIFRVSANYKDTQSLKDQLDTGTTVDFASQNVKVLASTLKEYLRSLPDCLLTSGLYNEWVQTLDLEDVVERIQHTKKIINRLEKCNYVLLKQVMCVLHHVQMNSDYNKMTSYNLAICIGQSMLWPPASPKAQTLTEAQATMKVVSLVQFLSNNSLEIFGDDLPFILGDSAAPKMIADSGTDSDSFVLSAEDSHTDNFLMSGNDELQIQVSLATEVHSIGSSLESPAPSPQSSRHFTTLPSHASSSLDSLELDSPDTPDSMSCERWRLSSDSGLFQSSDFEQDHPPVPPPRRSKSKLQRQPVAESPQMQRKSVSTPSLASVSPLPSPTQPKAQVPLRKCMTKKGADVYPRHLLRRSLQPEVQTTPEMYVQAAMPTQAAMPNRTAISAQAAMPIQASMNPQAAMPTQTAMSAQPAIPFQDSMQAQTAIPTQTAMPIQAAMHVQAAIPTQTAMPNQAAMPIQAAMHAQPMHAQPTQPAQPLSYEESMRKRVMLQSGLSVSSDEILQQKMNSSRAQELYLRSMEQYQAQADTSQQSIKITLTHTAMEAQTAPVTEQPDLNEMNDFYNYMDTGRVPRRSLSLNAPRQTYKHHAMDVVSSNVTTNNARHADVNVHRTKLESAPNDNETNVQLKGRAQTQQILASDNPSVRSTARDTTRSFNKTKQHSHSKDKNTESQERSESRVRKRAQAEKDRSSQNSNGENGEERVKARRKSYRQQRLSDTRLETERQNKVNLTRSKSDSCEHLGSLRLLSNSNNSNIPQTSGFNRPRRSSVTVKDKAWHKDLAQQYSKPLIVDVVPAPKYAYVNPETITTSTPNPKSGGTGRRWSRPVHPTRDLVVIDDPRKKSGQVQTPKARAFPNREEKENHHIPPPSPVMPIARPEEYTPQCAVLDQHSDEEELTISWSVAKLKNLFNQ